MPAANSHQMEQLVEFMELHPDLVAGRLTGQFTSLDMERLWTELSEQLNACLGGATKSHRRWKKVWQDTRAKMAKILISQKKTGGGPPCRIRLSALQQRIMALIVPFTVTGEQGRQGNYTGGVPQEILGRVCVNVASTSEPQRWINQPSTSSMEVALTATPLTVPTTAYSESSSDADMMTTPECAISATPRLTAQTVALEDSAAFTRAHAATSEGSAVFPATVRARRLSLSQTSVATQTMGPVPVLNAAVELLTINVAALRSDMVALGIATRSDTQALIIAAKSETAALIGAAKSETAALIGAAKSELSALILMLGAKIDNLGYAP